MDRPDADKMLPDGIVRALDDSERIRLAQAAGAIIGSWLWDVQTDRFTVDERFAESFGIDPALGREGLSLEQVIATVHPDDKPGLAAAIEEAIARCGRYSHQYRVRRADGQYYWIEANGRVDPDDAGRPHLFPGVLLDVEARRRMEDERDRARRLLEGFIEAVPGVVYSKDRQGRLLLGNRGVSELLGLPPEDYIGRTDMEFLKDKAQAAAIRANDERIMSSGVTEQVEETISLADGRRAIWFSTKAPLRDEAGSVIGLIGSSIDITARRDAETRYRALFESIDEGFCIIEFEDGPHGHLSDYVHIEANPAYAVNAGIPDVVGQRVREMVPDEAEEWVRIYREVLLTGEPIRFERELVKTRRYLELAAFRIGDVSRRHVAVLFQDITARKRAEAELRDLNATLERRVAEEVAERARAEEALRHAQKMEAVGQLTGGIAHDFNNLLTIIVGNVDMGLRALDAAGGDPRVRRAFENARKGAERAAALTQRLLAFSRRQPLAPKPLDADRLVSGMSDLLNRALGETVKLEIVATPGLWRIEADPNQLESAILNLAVNARDAMPQGGTLTVETANAWLDEAYTSAHAEVAPGPYVAIAVTDTGVGMSRETTARVFEPFFTTKEVGKGTGLGLSMVYGFTKQSGGHVKIYSEEGRGTTVKIYLPRLMRDTADEVDDAHVTPGLETGRARETILVAEDDDDVRAYTVECLRELGYRMLEAHDGPFALRLLGRQQQPIDLLLTDVMMPGMSGRQLADTARERQPGLRVLYTSGYTRNAIMHGGRLDPGVEMIAKPFTMHALAQKVRDVLDAGRTGRVLIVEDDPTVRMFAAEALAAEGYRVEEAATSAEALGKVRAAQGAYDAVVLDMHLPEHSGGRLTVELRAMYADLPLLLVVAEQDTASRNRLAGDRRSAVMARPYDAARLHAGLRALGVYGVARRGAASL